MIRHFLTTTFLMVAIVLGLNAQTRTTMPTLYKNFRSSVITFADGHSSRHAHTNVFLKNSSLLFLQGENTMEANMDNIVAVDFEDRHFVTIDNKLAYLVDSIKGNALYCIELFDKDTYERNLRNNVNISSMDISDQISMTYIDLNGDEDYKMPVFRHFYYLYNGQFVKVHERDLGRKLKKDKKTMMSRMVAVPGFSWQDEKSLMQLLKAISD